MVLIYLFVFIIFYYQYLSIITYIDITTNIRIIKKIIDLNMKNILKFYFSQFCVFSLYFIFDIYTLYLILVTLRALLTILYVLAMIKCNMQFFFMDHSYVK